MLKEVPLTVYRPRGGLRRIADLHDQTSVFVVAHASVHAGAAALEPFGVHARVLERPPARLQHEPLLGVQELRLDGRYAEERGVEKVDVLEVGTEAAGLALDFGVREKHAHATHARTRISPGHGVLAGLEKAPEGRNTDGVGESARHAHDGYGLTGPESLRRHVFNCLGRIEIPVRTHPLLLQVQTCLAAMMWLWNEYIL